ncbi:MAG: hypothetical protein ISR58_06345 [Anaerolineales bacterium]|nr:hypothetical protein [Chloroflexota bacterium]MBL6980797.1 hypothetical protein [Anaerolineales bacterium]
MALNWIDVKNLPFNSLLLLERAQLSWLPGWLPEPELGIALRANPVIAWYLCNKCPEIRQWVERVLAKSDPGASAVQVRQAEMDVMNAINDRDQGWHQFLVNQGYQWSRFEEPGDGTKRKYWKTIPVTKTFSLWERPAM